MIEPSTYIRGYAIPIENAHPSVFFSVWNVNENTREYKRIQEDSRRPIKNE